MRPKGENLYGSGTNFNDCRPCAIASLLKPRAFNAILNSQSHNTLSLVGEYFLYLTGELIARKGLGEDWVARGSISSEAGCEENLDARPTLGCTLDKVDAVHAWHHHVGDHQVNGALPLFADGECLISIRGVQDAVAHRL